MTSLVNNAKSAFSKILGRRRPPNLLVMLAMFGLGAVLALSVITFTRGLEAQSGYQWLVEVLDDSSPDYVDLRVRLDRSGGGSIAARGGPSGAFGGGLRGALGGPQGQGATGHLTAVPGHPGDVELAWSDGAVPIGDAVSHYEIERSSTGSATDWSLLYTVDGEWAKEYTDWGLDPGHTWHYRVRWQYYSGGYSEYSNVASATVPGWPPSAPLVDAYAAGTGGVYVQWDTYSDEDNPVTGHEIQTSDDGGSSYSALNSNLPASTYTYYHTGLSDGAERYYQVRSCSDNGCSEWSEASATVGEYPVPAPPTLTASASGSSAISLSWTEPDDGGSAITGYEVECSEDGSGWGYLYDCGWYPGADQRSLTHNNLLSDTERHYRIRGSNGNGSGGWSAAVKARTARGVPGLIENLEVTSEDDSSVALQWSEPRGGPISSYVLERGEYLYEGQTWQQVASLSGSATSYTDTGLYSGTSYTYRITPHNEVGAGPESYHAYATTTGASQQAPGDMGLVRISSISANSVTYAWDAPDDDGGRPITHYAYNGWERCGSTVTEFEGQTTGPSTSRTFSGLSCASTNLHEIEFRVVAWNELGAGVYYSPSYYSFAAIPNRGGTLNVSVSSLTISEGSSGSYTLRLNKAPTKDVVICTHTDGDAVIADQVPWWTCHDLTPSNWSQGVTITLTAPEDGDLDDHVAVIHQAVGTNSKYWAGPEPDFPDDRLDPAFHSVSGRSVKVTFTDTGSNTGDGGPGS
ncbi:MAG: hypothetical protein F4W95_10415 [Chloroflexi bacterium]|nr:hypothetical protein [Chloroflexota bacterium]MYD48886.1 hypothetical protein [Chloroflexota bacterium]